MHNVKQLDETYRNWWENRSSPLSLLCLSTFQGATAVPFDVMSPFKGKLKLHIAITPHVHQLCPSYYRYSSFLVIPPQQYIKVAVCAHQLVLNCLGVQKGIQHLLRVTEHRQIPVRQVRTRNQDCPFARQPPAWKSFNHYPGTELNFDCLVFI